MLAIWGPCEDIKFPQIRSSPSRGWSHIISLNQDLSWSLKYITPPLLDWDVPWLFFKSLYMNHQNSFWFSFSVFHAKKNVTWVRFSELNSDVRPLGSKSPLRSSEHKLNYQEFYSLKNTLYRIMSFSNRVKLAYIKFLGTRGKNLIKDGIWYTLEILHVCVIDLDFQFDCYTQGFNIGGFNIRGFIEFAFVFFRIYTVYVSSR